MKLTEYLEDLDPKLAGNLERALDAVRLEFEEKLTTTVEQTVAAAAKEAASRAAQAAEAAAAVAAAAPEAPPAAATVSLEASDELRLAALDIDRATSQSEILDALSRGMLRFASRVAVFVNRGNEIHGWTSTGFGEADGRIKEVSLGGDVPFPMAEHLSSGSVALSPKDCALICDALGAESPSMGLLLPFVLGSQVVGTVYCDSVGDSTLPISAAQVLTYMAGQTLETLPIRKRESTATLLLAGAEPGISDTAPAPPSPLETMMPAVKEAMPPAEPAAEPYTEPAPEQPAGEAEAAEEESIEGTVELPAAEASLSALAIDSPSGFPPAMPELEAQAPSPMEAEITRPGSFETEAPTLAEATAPQIERPAEPLAEALDESVTEPTQPTIALSSTQVAPPDDLQGPGWAFTSTDEASDTSSEKEHQEAQRLARLLVTEIKLYNEEAVEAGRRDADVYSRLQEDIDRSRQIFEDRIDPAVRNENDYFKQALVRILAGGDPSLLGI